MRCSNKKCYHYKHGIKHAGKKTRRRRVCGECMYATKEVIKTIYSRISLILSCRIRK